MAEKVIVGVCGGVAAYKAAELVRALQDKGLDVHVVMTRAAEEFVRPLTFASLTGHKVITSLWSEGQTDARISAPNEGGSAIEHIAEAQSTNLLLVAPATAHTLAKFAHGLADDFLSTLYLATTAPVIVAPAMNVNMWNHPATQANIATLRAHRVQIVEPEDGYLACGMTGGGRLANVQTIAAAVLQTLRTTHDLQRETILITAGGTREPLDPVRFLGNRSSGKMAYALAESALRRGAHVILISAPTALLVPAGCTYIPVTQSIEMHAAVLRHLPEATIVIAAAAVSDFRAAAVFEQKIKRTGAFTLTLEPTQDIVRDIVQHRLPGTLVIAFAAETENLLDNARTKLQKKGADAIVANDVSRPGLGFESDNNAATFLTPQGSVELPETSKQILAVRILDEVKKLRTPIHQPQFA